MHYCEGEGRADGAGSVRAFIYSENGEISRVSPCERSGGKYLRRNHIFSAMKAPRGRLSGVVSAAFLLRELTLMREPEEYLLRYAAAR